MKSIIITEPGGPDVLQLQERPAPTPGQDELLVRVNVAGVNYFDTAIRNNKVAEIPGMEGAGVVLATGPGVDDFTVGDRVAWLTIEEHGSYTEQALIPAAKAVPLPDDIDDETAAALLLQGLTAMHFATVSHAVAPGDTVVVHAAAGGVGLFLTQIVTALGGTVIGLVSRQEKVDLAAAAGADHVLVSTGGAFVERVKELTDGQGVHAVFDGAGGSTFAGSLEVLRRHGTLVYYGPLIGDVPTIAMADIPRSVRLTYGALPDFVPTPDELRTHTAELFEMYRSGALQVHTTHRYPLADAAKAHADIESRGTVGKLLLVP
jgi:NADPH:quinone reductase